MSRSGIGELYDSFIFSFWRSLCTVFHSGYTYSHSHQHCLRVVFPCILEKHWLVVFSMIVILTGVR
jgi:hypothetical protein